MAVVEWGQAMTGVFLALILTVLRPGAIAALSKLWHGSIDCDLAWTIWCAFLLGSYWGAFSVALCLLLDLGAHRDATDSDTSGNSTRQAKAEEVFGGIGLGRRLPDHE